jgi:sulfite reductase (NADPH) flavoprotein alpha-component
MLLGLIFCVFIAIVGITGALYSYSDTIRDFETAKKISRYESENSKVLSIEELMKRFLEQKQDENIAFFRVINARENIPLIEIVTIDKNGRYTFNSLNAYMGNIIELELISDKIFTPVMMLHRFLSFKRVNQFGKNIVAATTIIIIFLLITGIFLYSPMLKRNFLKSLRVDFKAKGYKFLYRLHSIFGIFTSVFILIMCLTGLWRSYEWYRDFLNNLTEIQKDSSLVRQNRELADVSPKEFQKVFEMTKETIDGSYLYIINTPFKDEPYKVLYKKGKYDAINTLTVDVEDDKIISHEIFEYKPLGQQLINSMYALHSGQYFGEFGKAVMCISSASMAMFSVSGAIMFYKRIKRNRKIKNTPQYNIRNRVYQIGNEINHKKHS